MTNLRGSYFSEFASVMNICLRWIIFTMKVYHHRSKAKLWLAKSWFINFLRVWIIIRNVLQTFNFQYELSEVGLLWEIIPRFLQERILILFLKCQNNQRNSIFFKLILRIPNPQILEEYWNNAFKIKDVSFEKAFFGRNKEDTWAPF